MATRWDSVPNLNEDVVKRTSEDVGKVKKRFNLDASDLKGGARQSVKEAGGRAAARLAGRAGLAGAALQGGYDLGREIDERTGIGKAMVDRLAGGAIDRAAAGSDRVTLSPDAQRRIARGELDSEETPTPKPAPPKPRKSASPGYPDSEIREGRNENIDDETRRRAMESTGYAKGGKVSSASSRGDGCAQRGKTRGKMR